MRVIRLELMQTLQRRPFKVFSDASAPASHQIKLSAGSGSVSHELPCEIFGCKIVTLFSLASKILEMASSRTCSFTSRKHLDICTSAIAFKRRNRFAVKLCFDHFQKKHALCASLWLAHTVAVALHGRLIWFQEKTHTEGQRLFEWPNKKESTGTSPVHMSTTRTRVLCRRTSVLFLHAYHCKLLFCRQDTWRDTQLFVLCRTDGLLVCIHLLFAGQLWRNDRLKP